MIKFMRKHNKKLLAIFASGLLVVWLGSSALEQMFRPDMGDEVVGTAFGQEFDRNDFRMSTVRTSVLEGMRVPWSMPWAMGRLQLPIRPIDPLTWHLLDIEAQRTGVEIPRAEAERFLKMMRIPGDAIENTRDRYGISVEAIFSALEDHLRITRVGQLASAGVQVSPPEVDHYVRNTQERVTVKLAAFTAADFADPKAKPSLEDMEKHFHEYRETLPGEGKHGFGYKWPDRIRVEYMVADVSKIEESLRVSRDDARRYWSDNRKKYTKEVPVSQPATKPATQKASTQPTTATKPATKTLVKSFSEARDEVIAEIKRRRAPEMADRLIRQAMRRLNEPWFDVRVNEETGYKPAPPGVDDPAYYERIAEEVCARADLPKGCLRVERPIRWLTRDEAARLEGIGQTSIEGQATEEDSPRDFVDIAFRVQGLYTPPDDRTHAGLALYETFNSPLRGGGLTADDFYLFRVLASEPTHAPKALEEVKEQVAKDLRLLEGYKKAGQVAKRFIPVASAKGLKEALKTDKDLFDRLGEKILKSPTPFARRRDQARFALQLGWPLTTLWPIEDLGVLEDDETSMFPLPKVAERYEDEVAKLIERCFDLAPKSGASTQPTRAVALVEMPVSRQWILVEFISIDRLTAELYAKARPQMHQMLQAYRTIEFMKSWYAPEQVKTRTGYEPALGIEG